MMITSWPHVTSYGADDDDDDDDDDDNTDDADKLENLLISVPEVSWQIRKSEAE